MHVVVVGGGFAGVKTALELMNKPGFEVTLISKGADFEYHGSLYRSATGHSPLEVVLRLGDIFEKAKNIDVVIDNIVALNPTTKYIRGETGRQYSYERLVMCLGNEKNYFGIPGLDVYAHSMYTIHDTMTLRSDMVNLLTSKSRRKTRVLVIGAGPSGVEVAAELHNFAHIVSERYGTTLKKIEVDLIEGSPRVLPSLSEKVSHKARARLAKIGVNVLLDKRVRSCSRNVVTLEDGERAGDIIIWTAGSKSADIFAKYPSLFEIERGRVKVGEYMQVPASSDIFILGDNAATKYSGMAQTALGDAIYLARNFIREQKGKDKRPYSPKSPAYVVPIGGKWAVMQKGTHVRSGAYGWAMRRRGDLYIYKNFEPIRKAYKLWRRGNHLAAF